MVLKEKAAKTLFVSLIFFTSIFTLFCSVANSTDIADIPLETQQQAAPGIVMFVLDDSGSMDWSFMMMSGEYAGDEGCFDINGDGWRDEAYIFSMDYDRRMYWRTQYTGEQGNGLYYNPSSEYTPWPRWNSLGIAESEPSDSNADINNPRKNPIDDNTFNLNSVFYDFSDVSDSDIENADGAIIVDNTDTESFTEVIVDDGDSGYSSFDADGPKEWPPEYNSASYNNYYVRIYDYQGTLPFHAFHEADLPFSGEYEVFVKWYSYHNRGDIDYTVFYKNGDYPVTIDQSSGPNGPTDWKSIGTFDFDANDPNNSKVKISFDGTGGESVSTDAVRFVGSDPGMVAPKTFIYEPESDWDELNKSDCYNGECLFAQDAGDYTAVWTANTLDSSKTYDIYTRWDDYRERSSSVNYEILKDDGTTVLESNSVDQKTNGGKWFKIASNIDFGSSTGIVRQSHTALGNETNESCADAVVFVPSDSITTTDISILNAHYYVKGTDNNYYLVNLNGDFEYYRVDDENNDDYLQDGELIPVNDDAASDAGIVPEKSYTEVRQNFANWYSFYRKREYSAKNAVAQVIDDMSGVRIGIKTINNRIGPIAPKAVNVTLDGTTYDESDELLKQLYKLSSSGSTPLRNGLKYAGEFYKGNEMGDEYGGIPSDYFSSDSYPYFKADKGGTCEQSFTIAMTDGFYNGSVSGISNEDGDDDTDFDIDEYADDYSSTLADIAMKYYETDLNSDLADHVPHSSDGRDKAGHQHMVTYSVAFGKVGAVNPDDYPNCPYGTGCPDWDEDLGSGNAYKIDDFYHAAINGRGQYLSAKDPEELKKGLEEIKNDIENRLGSAAGLATNNIQKQVGSYIYQGTYHTDNWKGELSAFPLNVDTGDLGNAEWTAASKLESKTSYNEDTDVFSDTRVIITSDGSSGLPFKYSSLTATQTDLLSEDQVNYLRGDTSKNTENGGSLRKRGSLLGDIVHSAPHFYNHDDDGAVVYVGANDGMLHAFRASKAETDEGDEDSRGEELFAFVPNILFNEGHLDNLTSTDYTHKYFVDGSPYVQKVKNSSGDKKDLLVSGLRKGGKGIFCLDVTNPFDVTEANSDDLFKWEFDTDDDSDMGYSFSRPYIYKVNDGGSEKWAVIFGNGYGSTNGKSALYVVNAFTGSLIQKFSLDKDAGENGLSSPALIDFDSDGILDYVYAGDLKGNLWKFDFTDKDDWSVAYKEGTDNKPLITVKNSDGSRQPITVEPDVTNHPVHKGYIVLFGTGKYISLDDDPSDTSVQSLYGIWDWYDELEDEEISSPETKYYGEFKLDRSFSGPNLMSSELTLINRSVIKENSTEGVRSTSDDPISWYSVPDDNGNHAGWYYDLPDSGERLIQNPVVRYVSYEKKGESIAVFVSSIPSTSPCDAGGSSWIYQFNSASGKRPKYSLFDINNDGKLNAEDRIQSDDSIGEGSGEDPAKVITGVRSGKMLYSPVIINELMFFNDSDGNIKKELTVLSPTGGVLYWRIIH